MDDTDTPIKTPDKTPISIIIPLAPNESAWRQLLPSLKAQIDSHDEILLMAQESMPTDISLDDSGIRWVVCKKWGRAAQMNEGAALAKNTHLWFVHADTQLSSDTLAKLKQAFLLYPNALHYFSLKFYDGNWTMRINEYGVRWRCALFSNPFGDQALALSTHLFHTLQGFNENAAYGEDHLLTIRARTHQTPLHHVDSTVFTSARRYRQQGWLKTILLFQYLWIKQWITQK